MKHCPDFEDIAAYIDGEYDGDPAVMARHLTACADCARTAAEINLINMAVRAKESQEPLPPGLADWMDAQDPPSRAPISRRQALGGLAVAASAVVAVFAMTRSSDRRQGIDTTLFRDFATLVAADGRLDLEDSDPERVLAWFEARVPFALPRLSGIGDVGVRGGRLCWLLERRVAALHLEPVEKGPCLYIADGEGLTLGDGTDLPAPGRQPILLSDGVLAGAFWRDGQLAFGLIGEGPQTRVERLARRLRASG